MAEALGQDYHDPANFNLNKSVCMNPKPPSEVFEAYEHLGEPLKITLIDMGLINKTWLIQTAHSPYILQEVSKIFDLTIHDDSYAVCEHISRKNMLAPAIIPDHKNYLYFIFQDRIFRALVYLKGQSFHKILNLTMAEQAGMIIGQFHRALINFNYDYRSKRRQAGDFAFHMNNLSESLKLNIQHEYFSKVQPLAILILNNMENLIRNLTTTTRHIHGDPKISNILFDENYSCRCFG